MKFLEELELFDRLKGIKSSNRFSGMEKDSTNYFKDEEYETWRNKMLANKKPFGMVPLAYDNEDGDYTMWNDDPNIMPTNLYTTPERAGLNELFEENPELNYQNPNNKMFPYEPNYPAIYAADKFMNESDETGKNIMDASEWFFKQKLNKGPYQYANGTNFTGKGIGLDKTRFKVEDRLDELNNNVLPHEFAHELEYDSEILDILPFPKQKGFNPAEGKHENKGSDGAFLHDILYNFEPHYANRQMYSGNEMSTMPDGSYDPAGKPIGPQENFALNRDQAMNYHVLQNFARRTLNKDPDEVIPNSSFKSWSNQNKSRTNRPNMRDVSGNRRKNSGGLVSLMHNS